MKTQLAHSRRANLNAKLKVVFQKIKKKRRFHAARENVQIFAGESAACATVYLCLVFIIIGFTFSESLRSSFLIFSQNYNTYYFLAS
jgi:hypothetical protein